MQTEPVTTAGVISVISAVLAPVLARWGIDEGGTEQIVGLVLAAIAAVLAVVSWVKARAKVTPLVRPQTDDGVPLVPQAEAA